MRETRPNFIGDWRILLFACFTLGLAPYLPEPHVWGKIKWLVGGAKGMQLVDWMDLIMHGLPWLLMMRYGWIKMKNHGKKDGI